MAEFEKMNEQELESVAGGFSTGTWVTVSGLQTGYLALRTAPNYDYANEIRGSESYNGQILQITGGDRAGPDGRVYVWGFNPRSGMSGRAHAPARG